MRKHLARRTDPIRPTYTAHTVEADRVAYPADGRPTRLLVKAPDRIAGNPR